MALAETTSVRAGIGVKPGLLLLLAGLVFIAALSEMVLGPVHIPPGAILAWIGGDADQGTAAILGQIRGPRVVLAILVGSGLALAGATLQGILRNPLADPGLIGVTGGASLGAVTVIVLGEFLFAGISPHIKPILLPVAAFIGAALITAFVFLFARSGGQTSVATLILAGVAINAIAAAGIGVMVYISDDQQLRDLTFWSMGSLGGAGWDIVLVTCVVVVASAFALSRLDRALDLFQIGERAAYHSGLDVERVKLKAGLLTALSVGAVTAAAGPIGFIGLVAPHMARLIMGAGHRWMLPASALIGTILILVADLAVRLAIPPQEPPIGLATSLIGGPFFLWLLVKRMKGISLA